MGEQFHGTMLLFRRQDQNAQMIDSSALEGAESEHRIDLQQNLISKLRAKRGTSLLAVEFLRNLQASRVMHLAGHRPKDENDNDKRD